MGERAKPQAILSSRDAGYDVQLEEMKSEQFVCRKCTFHPAGGDGRMSSAQSAAKHLAFHEEDGHRIDPKAMESLRGRM